MVPLYKIFIRHKQHGRVVVVQLNKYSLSIKIIEFVTQYIEDNPT